MPGTDRLDPVTRLKQEPSFEHEVFANLDLTQGDLSNKEFVQTTFRALALPESKWQRTRLHDCVFEGCNLTRLHIDTLALRGVTFIDCRLTGVDWTAIAPNPTVTFERCNLQYSSFVGTNLTRTTFRGCRLLDVYFSEARLIEATFPESDLTGARFEHCDLTNANFAHARGLLIDPAINRVKGAQINLATAVLLAGSLGLRVNGFQDEAG
jgi:fluoroquinolone resistance protein